MWFSHVEEVLAQCFRSCWVSNYVKYKMRDSTLKKWISLITFKINKYIKPELHIFPSQLLSPSVRPFDRITTKESLLRMCVCVRLTLSHDRVHAGGRGRGIWWRAEWPEGVDVTPEVTRHKKSWYALGGLFLNLWQQSQRRDNIPVACPRVVSHTPTHTHKLT